MSQSFSTVIMVLILAPVAYFGGQVLDEIDGRPLRAGLSPSVEPISVVSPLRASIPDAEGKGHRRENRGERAASDDGLGNKQERAPNNSGSLGSGL